MLGWSVTRYTWDGTSAYDLMLLYSVCDWYVNKFHAIALRHYPYVMLLVFGLSIVDALLWTWKWMRNIYMAFCFATAIFKFLTPNKVKVWSIP